MTHLFLRPRTFVEGAKILLPQIGLLTLIRDIGKVVIKSLDRKASLPRMIAFIGLFVLARFSYWRGYIKRQRFEYLINSKNPMRRYKWMLISYINQLIRYGIIL